MAELAKLQAAFQNLSPNQKLGHQLGHLEYLVTPEALEQYRTAIEYPSARFPNLAVREFREVLTRQIGELALTSEAHTDRYFTPPILDRRVQVTGWLRESFEKGGRDWLVIETFGVDEIGTEISRSEHTYVVGEPPLDSSSQLNPPGQGDDSELPQLVKTPTAVHLEHFAAVNRTLTGGNNLDSTGQFPIPEELGLSYLHELVDRKFGIDFRQGGRLSVRYLRAVSVGETVTAGGRIDRQEKVNGRDQFQLSLWLKNQRDELTVSGEAQVTVPSPLT
jgi:hypothetical protein